MKTLTLLTVGLFTIAYAGAASAADYPLCSKTVTDECTNPSEAHGKADKPMTKHMHHAPKKAAAKTK